MPDPDDAADSEDADVLIGELIASRYLVEARLGHGSTGTVYRARHVKVGRAFAVKVLHAWHIDDTQLLRRFEREAELGGRLRHPNLISVVDVGELPDGSRYMVMELAQGTDLATIIHEDAPLTGTRTIALVGQILDGLHHAHERGVIHRDLKPENILVERTSDGAEIPRIVDFGIAIARDEAQLPEAAGRLTTDGTVLGTPHYMAPEQATGAALDHRVDLFALGVIVFEMVTGEMPYPGSGVEVARANMLLPTPAMGVRVPHLIVDPLLEAFTHQLMSKSPEVRPKTAQVARDLLDRIARDRAAASSELGVSRARTLGETAVEPEPPPPRAASAAVTPAPTAAPPVARASDRVAAVSDGLEPPPPRSRTTRNAVLAVVAIAAIGAGAAVWKLTSSPARDDVAVPAPRLMGDVARHVVIAPAAVTPVAAPPTPPPPIDVPAVESPPEPPTPAPTPRPQLATPAKPTPAPPPAPTPEPPPPDTSTATVATLYATVGRELVELGDARGDVATQDLWPRYRRFRINEVLADPARRAAIAGDLTQLHHDIAARRAAPK